MKPKILDHPHHLTAAVAGTAINEIGFSFIQLLYFIQKTFGIEIDEHRVFQVT